MKKKITTVFIVLFGLQFATSCCPNHTLEYTVTGVTSRNLILNGIHFVEVDGQTSINKEDLLLEVLFTGTESKIGSILNEISKVGIQSIYASIDCEDVTVVYKNKIQSIAIFVRDLANNGIETEITNDLVIEGSQKTIADYIRENNPNVHDGILIDFKNTNNLPNQAEFIIRTFLDDSRIIETTTNRVNFK